MRPRSISARAIALIAAYLVALQALLAAALAAQQEAGADALFAWVCSDARAADQSDGRHQTPCAPDCAMPGCAPAGAVPVRLAVMDAPASMRALPAPVAIPLGQADVRRPHNPRAPPRA